MLVIFYKPLNPIFSHSRMNWLIFFCATKVWRTEKHNFIFVTLILYNKLDKLKCSLYHMRDMMIDDTFTRHHELFVTIQIKFSYWTYTFSHCIIIEIETFRLHFLNNRVNEKLEIGICLHQGNGQWKRKILNFTWMDWNYC